MKQDKFLSELGLSVNIIIGNNIIGNNILFTSYK